MMKPQLNARLTTSLIALFLISILVVMVKYFLFDGFLDLERRQALRNMERASSALENDISHLAKETADWAEWDDAYHFTGNRSDDFIRTNIPDSTFSNLRINLIIFADKSGKIVYGASYDQVKGRTDSVPESVRNLLRPGSPLLDPSGGHSGTTLLPEGPLILASNPVLDTAAKKPARGVLIMGRHLDGEFLAMLSQISQLPVSLHAAVNPALPPEYRQAVAGLADGTETPVISTTENSIASHALIRDIFGKPALVLTVETSREIYRKGLSAARYFILWFSLAVLVAVLIINTLFDKLLHSRQKGKESEERYQSVVKHAAEGIVIVDAASKLILESNEAFLNLLGFTAGEITGTAVSEIIIDRGSPSADRIMLRLLKEQREIKMRRKDGTPLDVEVSASFITHGDSDAVCLMVRDSTERKRFEERLLYEATHDTLTGLPNRNQLNSHLNRVLAYGRRHQQTLALFLLDLDNFKIVNDSLGHSAGDQLLVEVAERLSQCVRRYDMVARLGGDEFVIVLFGIRDTNDITLIADKILSVFSRPFMITGHEMFITVSIGIALAPANGDKAETLLMNADTAMYNVKGSGRNGYEFFSEKMNARLSERLDMESKLRRALERREFLLHYQPKINVANGAIIGMEALLRWMPETGKIVSPSEFIPLLEETGLIIPVGEWVIREACSQNKSWQDAGLAPLAVSTNISARQFYQKNISGMIEDILRETGLEARWLKIELTESIVMQDIDVAIATLLRLKEMGIAISIDDFGTGYSSLAYLKRFPVDELKIDKSFINGLGVDASDSTIVNSIIAMAHNMDITVVAEGVETEEQFDLLRERKCEEVQGFYFSRPLAASSFAEMMRTGLAMGDSLVETPPGPKKISYPSNRDEAQGKSLTTDIA